jgi:hypothetical protein
MTDRIVNSIWWLAVMSMICTATCVALYIGYRALFELFAAKWAIGVTFLSISLLAALAALQLCRHRNDLL